MISIILESTLVAVIAIGFIASVLCAFACRMSGNISREEGDHV